MKKKNTLLFIILIFLLLVSAFLGLLFGSVDIPASDTLKVLTGRLREGTSYILIATVRLPRVLGCIGAGVGLATAGVILQNVMNNSLASPNTIGVNSSAGLAVMLSMVFFPEAVGARPVFAFAGALITSLLIFALAWGSGASRTTVILAGITVSAFLSAAINLIKILDDEIALNINTFMIGSVAGISMKDISLPLLLICAAFVIACLFSGHLNVLALGDDIAGSLGMNVNAVRFFLLTLSSLLAGAVISYTGLLAFVGLIVPHICRRLFGTDNGVLIPASGLLGASYVLLCDLLGRVIAAPYELPAGIIMSFIGGPFFLFLLLRKRGGRRVAA